MKKFLALLLICLAALAPVSFANVNVQEDGVSEGQVYEINFSTGLNGTVSGGTVTVTADGAGADLTPANVDATNRVSALYQKVNIATGNQWEQVAGAAATGPAVCGNRPCPVAAQYQLVAPYIIALQYVRLPYVNGPSATYRPSSTYSPRGAVIALGDARNATDCGAVGLGTTYVVCTFDGSNWKAL